MFRKVDKYILKAFLPMLAMTFLICWFIVLMQFLWRYIDELVGKGLDMVVVVKTVFYAALSLVPLSLPLGILLACLMTFGNMGERLELLAMKATGIPLYRIMRPIFVTVVLLAGGLFVFQNTIMVDAQLRLWTNILSARQTSPELEIPEGTFYSGIQGYSVFVKHRHPKTGTLYDVMIYDVSKGTDQARIIRADSGRLSMDESKLFLSLELHQGVSFENLGSPSSAYDPKPISHARERFTHKEIIIPFDANIKMMDKEALSGLYIARDLNDLQVAIDSSTLLIDSIRSVSQAVLVGIAESQRYSSSMPSPSDTTQWAQERRQELRVAGEKAQPIDIDSVYHHMSLQDTIRQIDDALSDLSYMRTEAENRLYNDKDAYYSYRTNKQEWHRKFTFPVACLVFFFIGVPLGAIIRKGGLGMPVIVAVSFFIFYYVIDTFGFNMVVSESMSVPVGMWLSTTVLFPIGAFLTYKATRDSTSLNADTYVNLWRKLIGTYTPIRSVEANPLGTAPEPDQLLRAIEHLREANANLLGSSLMNKRISWVWLHGASQEHRIAELSDQLEALVAQLVLVDHPLILSKTKDLPVLSHRFMPWPLPTNRRKAWLLLCLLPLSLPYAFLMRRKRRQIRLAEETLARVLGELQLLVEGIR